MIFFLHGLASSGDIWFQQIEAMKDRFRCLAVSYPPPPNLDQLGIPTLIIEADNDPLVDVGLREMLKTVYPSANVKTFHQAGHFPYLNRPEDYSRALLEFLA